MPLQFKNIAVGNLQDDVSGNNYAANKAVYILNLNNTLAQIFSDEAGTIPIVQDGVNNVTGARGVFGFWVEAGDYFVQVGANKYRVSITGADYFNNRVDETVDLIVDSVAGRGAYYPVGSFEAGFTYTDINQVGTFGGADYYVYTGGLTNLPHHVPAGTDPTLSSDYAQAFFGEASNVANANGGSAQDYFDVNRKFESVSAMLAYTKYKSGDVVETSSYYGGWAASSTAPVGGAKYIIKPANNYTGVPNGTGDFYVNGGTELVAVNISKNKTFEMYGAIAGSGDVWQNITDALASNRVVRMEAEALKYEVSQTVKIPSRRKIIGNGEETGFKWIGAAPGNSPNKMGGTSVLDVSADNPATTSLSNVGLSDFGIDLNQTAGLIGMSWIYASRQSYARDIVVDKFALNCVGFYFSKTWYASFNSLSARTSGKPTGSVGFYLSSYHNQINGVPFSNSQVNGTDIGVLINTEDAYQYGNTLSGLLENLNTGVLHEGGFGVRQMNCEAVYFENNSVADINWSTPLSPSDKTGDIVWQSCSFNANGSNVVVSEGSHRFLGCNIISDIAINDATYVWMDGNAGISAVINGTGWLEHVPRLDYKVKRQTYSSNRLAWKGGASSRRLVSAGVQPAEVFSVPDDLTRSNGSEGLTIKVVITARRTYAAVERFFEGYLVLDSTGNWELSSSAESPPDSIWSVSLNSSNGDISVQWDATDSKVINVSWEPF